MELTAKDLLKLGRTSLFVATPCFGGQLYQNHYQTMMQVCDLARQVQMAVELHTLTNMSLIPRARNILANRFLESSCTHMLWVDADVSFEAREVLGMVLADREIVGGTYPKKRLNWRLIKEAVLRNPDIDPELLQFAGQEHTVVLSAGQQHLDLETLQQVDWLGAGLMLVSRSALVKIRDTQLEDRYYTDMDLPDRPRHWEFFPQGLIATDDYVGEDYAFCRLARRAGVELWLAPWIRTEHWGTHVFRGDLRRQFDALGELPLSVNNEQLQ